MAMINVQVPNYCQNCPEFEPVVKKELRDFTRFSVRDNDYVGEKYCDTTITCVHAERCWAIHKYIQKEEKKKNDLQGKT